MPAKTEDIILVPLGAEHLDRWRCWINDEEIAGLLDRNMQHVGTDEHLEFFRRNVLENPCSVWFAILDAAGGRHLGNVWLWNIDLRHKKAEVRIVVGERDRWGSGLGRTALRKITDYGHGVLRLHKLYAYVMERNPRARAAFERAGYTLEATLAEEALWEGKFCHVFRMSHIAQRLDAFSRPHCGDREKTLR